MTNPDKQREILMETRTAQQVLQFALNRERGQENQTAINSQLNRYSPYASEQISNITTTPRNTSFTPRSRPPIRNTQTQWPAITPNPCRRWGIQFSNEHLQVCPAKKVQCNLCKKIGHYSKVCRSAKFMWQTQQIKPQTTSPQQTFPQTRRVRNIRPAQEEQQEEPQLQDTRTEATDETSDLENTFYIQEVFDSWNTVNLIHPKNFVHAHPQKLSPNISDEIWIKTSTDTFETNWLADTGSPRSFICKTEAERIIQMCKSAKWKEPTNGQTQYRCFNNIEIPITGIIQINLRSGLREATNNEILMANTKLTNANLAELKQSYAFQLSQNPANFNELSKKPTARVFKERSPGHTKPFIIATSWSAADFMLTPKRSTVSTIAKSPPMQNIRKSKAEATVKKLNVEKAIANISLSPSTDDCT